MPDKSIRMPINIQIDESQIQSLVEFYGLKLEAVRTQKQVLEQEEKKYVALIGQLTMPDSKHQNTEKPEPALLPKTRAYSASWPIHEKIKHVLIIDNRPLSSRDIINRLLSLEPALNVNKEKTAKNISTVLSIRKGDLFERVEMGGQNYYKLIEKAAV